MEKILETYLNKNLNYMSLKNLPISKCKRYFDTHHVLYTGRPGCISRPTGQRGLLGEVQLYTLLWSTVMIGADVMEWLGFFYESFYLLFGNKYKDYNQKRQNTNKTERFKSYEKIRRFWPRSLELRSLWVRNLRTDSIDPKSGTTDN